MATQKYEEKEWLEKFLNIRIVIIEVRPGETKEEAWRHHLAGHPEDLGGAIRIFNHRPLKAANNFE
jgi:hypothetical protein